MKKNIFLLVILNLLQHLCLSQKQGQAHIDSLLTILPDAKADTSKLKILSELSFSYHNIDPDIGIQYGEQLLTLATQLNEKKFIGYGYLELGINFMSKSDFPKALDYELKALDIFERIGDKKSMAKPMNNIGIIYFNQNDMDKALEYYFKALKIYEVVGMKVQVATTLGNMGLVYQNKEQIDKALDCDKKALAVFKELNDQSGIARMLGNIGNIYDLKLDYPNALKNKFEGLTMFQQLGDLLSTANVYHNISYTYMQIVLDTNKIQLPDSLSGKNRCLQKAEHFEKQALEINRSVGSLNDLKDNYKGLSNIYLENKDFEKSLEFYRKFIQLKDSIYSEENQRKIKAIEAKKADELQQKKLEVKNLQLQSAKRERWYFISGLLALLVFSFLIYQNFITQKHTNKLLSVEKKKSDDLLLNILPSEVAEELKQKGSADAKQFDDVTVMFTDFKNFTQISEKLSPNELVAEIDYYFKAFDKIITRCNIEKIKTIGDSYMCAGGLSVVKTTNANDVVKAAIEIRDFMAHRQSEIRNPKFEIRIGVHTGPVVAGIVGVKKFAYDIWGDTVNIASRMESSGEAGKVNISGSTYVLVKDKFTCTHRGKIQAKNKGEIDMYFVETVS